MITRFASDNSFSIRFIRMSASATLVSLAFWSEHMVFFSATILLSLSSIFSANNALKFWMEFACDSCSLSVWNMLFTWTNLFQLPKLKLKFNVKWLLVLPLSILLSADSKTVGNSAVDAPGHSYVLPSIFVWNHLTLSLSQFSFAIPTEKFWICAIYRMISEPYLN